MTLLATEKLSIKWLNNQEQFSLNLPWLTLDVEVDSEDKNWIEEASNSIHTNPTSPVVQKFLNFFREYPIFFHAPRKLNEFSKLDLQPCLPLPPNIKFGTPLQFLNSLGIPASDTLIKDTPQNWKWDFDKIAEKALIPGTDLYDPVSFVSYLILYRLEQEGDTWTGQDGLGKFLESLLKEDEEKFFKAVGWISRQSHYVTTQFHISVLPSLKHFSKAKDLIQHFIQDEVGHYKFMDQVLKELDYGLEDFKLGDATSWQFDVFELIGTVSPLAFSAIMNIFEIAYYGGQDPIAQILKKSSKPKAAKGYDQHYKINQVNRHCDIPVQFSERLGPQTYEHLRLTVCLFELTLHFLDEMEKAFVKDLN